MPVAAVRAISKAQNGVGAFVLQCKRIDFHYCDWAGSSKGMNMFLKSSLAKFAAANPAVEITVSPRPRRHPVIRGHYINGKEKSVCVRNLEPAQIMHKATLLTTSTGEKPTRGVKPVRSLSESVRGIWDPYHGGAVGVRDVLGLGR